MSKNNKQKQQAQKQMFKFKKYAAPTGSKESIIWKVDPKDNRKLVNNGKRLDYDIMQTFADDTNINLLVSRAAKGDVEIMDRLIQPSESDLELVDLTGMPSSIQELKAGLKMSAEALVAAGYSVFIKNDKLNVEMGPEMKKQVKASKKVIAEQKAIREATKKLKDEQLKKQVESDK